MEGVIAHFIFHRALVGFPSINKKTNLIAGHTLKSQYIVAILPFRGDRIEGSNSYSAYSGLYQSAIFSPDSIHIDEAIEHHQWGRLSGYWGWQHGHD
jgi:hypothetical protein